MKKLIMLLMCAVLVLALASCSLLESAATPGKDGADGITPDFKVEEGEIFVSYDGGESWTSLGYIQGADGKDGVDGAPGEKGDKGDTGEKGDKGDPGEDGKDGAPGEKGDKGDTGADGITPEFKLENGEIFVSYDKGENWTSLGYVQGADGKDGVDGAPGEKGDKGDTGEDGKDAENPVIEISEDGYWVINGVKTEYKATNDDADPVCQHRDADDNYYCDKCEKPYVDGTDVPQIPDHTHNYSEWKYYSESFEYCEDALYFRTCSGCNAIEWKDGSEDDHKYVVVITPPTCYSIGYTTKTCSKCGKTVVYNETSVVDHTYSTSYTSDGSYHWRQCKYCDRKADYAEHGLDENGICTVCSMPIGDTAGVIYEVSADGTYAEVAGYVGTAKQVKIASEYKGLPITNIYSEAFYGNNNITHVVIPDSVTTIGYYAFSSCSSLTSVTIGDSVTTIGSGAFFDCSNLQNITVDANNDYYASIDGDLYTKDKKTLVQYAQGKNCTEFTIPDSVTTIGSYAFASCSSLTSVTIPDSVTTIGSYAFYNCDSLTSVTIGDSVTTIGNEAFRSCSKLTSVTIGDSVTTIGTLAFYDCDSLTSVTIPDSVTTIGNEAFYSCSKLTSVTIGDSVTTIGIYAFEYCSSLTSVTFEDPTSWWRSSIYNATSGAAISESDLANAYTAAYYLGDYYSSYYWFKD